MGHHTDTLKGKVKEATGTVTGDDSLRREGKMDQFSGDVKRKGESLSDKTSDKLRDAADSLDRQASKHT